MEFFMAMDPPTATAQERRVAAGRGRPAFYDPPRVREARQALMAGLEPHAPPEPMEGPLELYALWCFPRGRRREGEWKPTRPDTDNLQKLLKDCMTAQGFWRDDAQVAREVAEKRWSGVPGIFVSVRPIGGSR